MTTLSLVQPPVEIPNFPEFVHRTEVGLTIKKKNLSFEEWEATFNLLKKNEKSHQWQIGDALIDGEARFGEDCFQVIDPDEEEERDDDGKGETYRSYQWVAQKIPAVHRCTNVPWTLHRDVAGMEPEERNYWLQKVSAARAAGERFGRRRLAKEIKRAREPKIDGDLTLTEAMQKIHDQAVREELDAKIVAVDQWLMSPPDPVLTTVYEKIKSTLTWQRNRTPENDCAAILKSLNGDVGTEAPERISDKDLAAWLHDRGFIMSKGELGTGGCPPRCTIDHKNNDHKHIEKSGRLGLMVRLKMLTVETREESGGEDQRGAITSVYALEMDFALLLDEIALKKKVERDAALHRDWVKRIERYAPELIKKEEDTKAA